eukprot:TRINITY_DN5611_c0_g1_i8.p1 TRINITY_DN5611_c0_g1~~TRINITY_DN5611_c0_g1_i8.p1  ORF type:complete len:534 (-),score=151.45 TRINITY_DN5611_c0_g1_i8:140-1741(-)
MLSEAKGGLEAVLGQLLIDLYKPKTPQFIFCETNLSSSNCKVTFEELKASRTVTLAVINTARNRTSPIRVKVPKAFFQVYGPSGSVIPADVICANATDENDCDLWFTDSFNVLESRFYQLRASTSSLIVKGEKTIPPFSSNRVLKLSKSHTFTITSNFTDFIHDVCDDTGKNCKEYRWRTQYKYYQSYQGTGNDQNSGPKIFRPDNATMNASKIYAKAINSTLYQGKTVVQININWGNVVSDIRFYLSDLDYFEIETYLDSIDVTDGIGKEVTINFQTLGLSNNNTFYTDANGLDFQKRVTGQRETWKWKNDQPAAGNYYPVTAAIYLEDVAKDQRFAVLNDRPQGGGVVQPGEIELMINRRLLADDGHGVEEPLNELDWDGKGIRQRVRHYVLQTPAKENVTTIRILQARLDQPELVMVGTTANQGEQAEVIMPPPLSLGDFVPKLVKFFLRPFPDGAYLVRFHNTDDQNPITFDQPPFFANFNTIRETTLTANQDKSKSSRRFFGGDANPGQITLRPLEIRTFVLSNNPSA